MPTELAVESFLSLLQRSRVIPKDQMPAVLEDLTKTGTSFQSSAALADDLVAREALTRWQADQLLQGRHRGFFLGPYRILGVLGKGGMGTVYLAEHQMMRRRCAIKVLPTKHRSDETSTVDRFYREAQAVAALDHPNIVRAYDVNKVRINRTEFHYLVMEYIAGQDLQRMVEEHGVCECRKAVKFIRQAAEGLAHAHKNGLVHRDIKPANLLVDSHDLVKILDLGLAKFFDEEANASVTGEHGDGILGTADYLAPEQALDSHNVDARADIYGLGQTCYFLLVGHPPFPKGTVAERLLAHQTKSPEPIVNTRSDVPADLVAIIDKMCAKRREGRFQTAEEVGEALDDWVRRHADDSKSGRMSALLKNRPRPSSPPRGDPTRATSASSEETELELAPLEEEEPAPASGSKAPSAAKKDDQPSASQGKGPSTSDVLTPSPGTSKPDDSRADEQRPLPQDLSDVGQIESDLMAVLAEDESMSAFLEDEPAPPPPPQPSPMGSSGVKLRKKRKPPTIWETLRGSPVFWTGVAATVIVVLVVGIVLIMSSTKDVAPRPVPQVPEETTAPAPPKPAAELPPVRTEPQPPGEQPVEPIPPAPQPPDTEKAATPETTGTAAEKPPVEKAPEPAPDPPPVTEKPPVEPQPPQGVETKPTDGKVLLGSITEFSYQLVKSIDPNPSSKLNLMVKQKATQALQRADLTLSQESDSAVMHVTLEAVEKDAMVNITMSAELQCRDSNAEFVKVWEHREKVGSVSPQVLRRGMAHTALRKGVGKVFDRFVSDYQNARAEAGKPQ